MKLEDVDYKPITIDKKEILVVRFDYQYPLGEDEITNITQTISNIINKDDRFLNRVIFLPKGFEIENLEEQDFIEIWKSKVDGDFVDSIIDEDEDPNQLKLFQEVIE
tara:strand:+ start:1398 stop:1718 length:321 start_codon:yes stop_codon:yes gene_type:complete